MLRTERHLPNPSGKISKGGSTFFYCEFLGLTSELSFTIIWERGFTNVQEAHMAKDTKEKILATALELFSQNGYAGTNIRELTASLGMHGQVIDIQAF